MDAILLTAASTIAIILIYLIITTDDKLLKRFAFAKKQDRSLKNSEFFVAVFLVVLFEAVLFRILKLPFEQQASIITLSAYLPLTFFFYCNVFLVGNRRELIWVCIFLILCLGSLLIFRSLRFEWILPLSISSTAVLCFAAMKSSYTHYRRGLRYLDEQSKTDKAVAAFEKAHRMEPTDPRFLYHLGRSNILQGNIEKGREMIGTVISESPGILEQMRKDPLFREEWLAVKPALQEDAIHTPSAEDS